VAIIVVLQFFCFLLIIVVAEIAAGVWAYSNSDKLEVYVKDAVRSTVQHEYGVVDTRTKTFDAIQEGVCEESFCVTIFFLLEAHELIGVTAESWFSTRADQVGSVVGQVTLGLVFL
jgi:hypothetical protein